MTAISANSAALTILNQASPLATGGPGNATDAILDIVSGRSTVGSKATDAISSATKESQSAGRAVNAPSAVGGSVSSEISRATLSAMSAATVSQLSQQEQAAAAGFVPLEASVGNAEAIAGRLVQTLMDYNGQFDLQKIPSRDEHMAKQEAFLAKQLSEGVSQEQIARNLEFNFGEGGYERTVKYINRDNMMVVSRANTAESSIGNLTMLLGQVFGKDVSIARDEQGRLTLGAFDITDGNGQKMLSYSADGTLSTFGTDGSLIRSLSGKDYRNL